MSYQINLHMTFVNIKNLHESISKIYCHIHDAMQMGLTLMSLTPNLHKKTNGRYIIQCNNDNNSNNSNKIASTTLILDLH